MTDTKPNGNGNGWKKHITFDRALLLIVVLFSGGQYWERQQQTNVAIAGDVATLASRVQAAEQQALGDRAYATTTYVRQDVVEVRLRAIEKEIAELKDLVRGLR